MKKVMLDIVLMDETTNVPGYAFFTVGFQTRKYLYVRILENQKDTVEKVYIRVKKSDTKIEQAWSLVEFDVYRSIYVSYDEGLLDERLEVVEDSQIIEKLDDIASWYEVEMKKVI